MTRIAKMLRSIVLALGLAYALTACTGSSSSGPEVTPSAVPSAALPSPVDSAGNQAQQDVIAVYDGYLEAYVKASATADYRTKELAKFVGEPLLGQLLNNLQNMSRSGVHNEGRPTWNPTVTELRLDAGEAVIQDCFDSTDWNTVGGQAPPTIQAKRYPVVVKVKRVGEKWYVYESTASRSSAC